MPKITSSRYIEVMTPWLDKLPEYLRQCEFDPSLCCYGTGESAHWPTQSNCNVFAALAVLSEAPELPEKQRLELRGTALSLLRYAMATHVTGRIPATDGKSWGHHWISVLGLERMSHGINAIREHLTEGDRARPAEPHDLRIGLAARRISGRGRHARQLRQEQTRIEHLERRHPAAHRARLSGRPARRGIPRESDEIPAERPVASARRGGRNPLQRQAGPRVSCRLQLHAELVARSPLVPERRLHGDLPVEPRHAAFLLPGTRLRAAAGALPPRGRPLAAGQSVHVPRREAAADRRRHPRPLHLLPELRDPDVALRGRRARRSGCGGI